LVWESSFNGGSNVIDYTVSISEEGSETFTTYMTGLATTSTVVTGLSANKTYRFVVKARNAIGYSLVSQITNIKTLPEFVGEKPSAPINLQNDPTKTNAD